MERAASALTWESESGGETERRYGVTSFPIIAYTPETSLSVGAGATATHRGAGAAEDDRPDSVSGIFLYTLKNQVLLSIRPEVYLGDYAWNLRAHMAYRKFPEMYYGLGNDTDEDDEEAFTTEDILFQPWILRSVWAGLRAGFFYDFKKTSILEVERGGLIERSDFTGEAGGLLSGLGPVLEWDSRDNFFNPRNGWWVQLSAGFYRDWLGSDFEYESYTVDVRHYRSLRPSHVLAFQLYASVVNGDVPFTELVKLEGIRGIHESRFRDRKAALAQMEYRFPIRGRFSGVVFTALGDVTGDVGDYDPGEIKYAFGVGLRYMLNRKEKINIRFDIGFSPWGFHPYFRLLEAF